MPPSKAKHDPLYDDRMLRMLRAMDTEHVLDIRELLAIHDSTDAAHTTTARPTVAALIANLEIDDTLAHPAPRSIALVDDVITTGADFVAAKTVLAARFPDVPIRGLFVARRVFDDETS